MLVYFVRHGEAVAQGDDWERPLTSDGANLIRAEAAVLKTLGVHPTAVFSSPLPRAVQTAEILVEALCPDSGFNTRDELAPGADLGDVATVLSGLENDAVAMIVGHEPDLSSIVGKLISESGARVKVRKGGVALVNVLLPVAPNSGELLWLLEPRVLVSS